MGEVEEKITVISGATPEFALGSKQEHSYRSVWKQWMSDHREDLARCGMPCEIHDNEGKWGQLLGHGYVGNLLNLEFTLEWLTDDRLHALYELMKNADVPETGEVEDFLRDIKRTLLDRRQSD